MRPEETKVKAVNEMARPQTKDVRSFLGLIGYYRRFIQNFAEKAEPLTNLTKKGLPEIVVWTERTEDAYQTLKYDLSHSVMLRNPDFTQTFQLQTDASDVGVGAVLSQGGASDQPIAYYSRKLLEREKNYSTVEKECLAILLGVKAFAIYLLGKPFVLQTDNRALTWLKTLRDKNARLTRWSLALQPYTFEVQHRRGRENANADALSRLPLDSCFAREKRGRNVTDQSIGSTPIDKPIKDQLMSAIGVEPITSKYKTDPLATIGEPVTPIYKTDPLATTGQPKEPIRSSQVDVANATVALDNRDPI